MSTIRVPASSANLGAGFDVLGMAVDRYLEVEFAEEGVGSDDHLTMRVFRQFGGTGGLSIRSTIPPARGLGFSGAARVAGLLAAAVQKGSSIEECRRWLFLEATELEGHPDNVAPSVFGGAIRRFGSRRCRTRQTPCRPPATPEPGVRGCRAAGPPRLRCVNRRRPRRSPQRCRPAAR